MSVVCARRDCNKGPVPDADGLTRYLTVLCAGAEGHRGNSSYVHRDCGDRLNLDLVARVDYLPFCREVAIAHGTGGGRISEIRADAYYYCGHPACLAELLKLYGSPEVKEILEQARTDARGALGRSSLFAEGPRRQLEMALMDVAAKARLERGVVAIPEPAVTPVQPAAPAQVTMEPLAFTAGELQRALESREGRPAESKNVLVVGAGAVGSFFATRLLAGGHRVVLMDRKEMVEAIRPGGLHVKERRLVQSARPTALVTSLEEAFPARVEYDLLLMATKAYDVAPVLRMLPGARFPLPRKVMTVQNGVGVEEIAERLLGPEHVLAGSLTVPVSPTSPGQVTLERLDCGLGVAPVARGEDVIEWARVFAAAGIKVKVFRDYQSMKWSKLLLNIIANATCAILDRPPGAIYRYRPTFRLEYQMLREALAVVKKMGVRVVDLPGAPAGLLPRVVGLLPAFVAERVLANQIGGARGEKMPSLQMDLAAGKRQSEVTYMNGAVVRQGMKLGVPTPVNYLLTDTLDKLFKQVLLWDDFRGKPEALLALYQRQG
jgi:2-dehydropantoate 2-reductase